MKPGGGLIHATLQHMRHPKRVTDLTYISLAAILHHAGATDYFESANFRQPGQNVVLNAIGKKHVFFVLAQTFKRQYGNASCCRTGGQFAFPNHHTTMVPSASKSAAIPA